MDDLIGEFIEETAESLAILDSELVNLERNPNDEKTLGNIFRLVHTIKGTCGFLGLPRLESVAHAAENVLGRIRDKTLDVSPAAISLILQSLDTIKELVAHLGSAGVEPAGSDAELIKKLNAFLVSSGGAAPAIVPAVEIQAEETMPASPPIKQERVADTASELVETEDPSKKNELAANQSIRVNLDLLESLMQMVGELVLTRNQLLQVVRHKQHDKAFTVPVQRLSLITSELQDQVMKTRMQPIGNAWAKFPRMIRDLSMELDKKIELRMLGAETELDRQLLEMIKDPLTHMIRNSADHGLENPAERRTAGKPEMGTITLSAYHEGGHIIIEISDDGRGINIERIKEKAIAKGMATEAEIATMSDGQICQFIFKAGFSTAEKVTSVSGRGVGMDVVRNNIEKIGGTIELESQFGKGSVFHIKIPLTLAIVPVLVLEVNGQRYALPQINIAELVRVTKKSQHRIEEINGAAVLRLREKLLPLLSLTEIFGEEKQNLQNMASPYIVICKTGGMEFGLVVDKIFDTEEIVVKPKSQMLKDVDIYSGTTILGDGGVIMILDPTGLARCIGEVGRIRDELMVVKPLQEKSVGFLLFSVGDKNPKAVPLELVTRLEELEMLRVEYSNGHPIIQYRDTLMRLITLDGGPLPNTETCEVIVFQYDGRVMGLAVERILDIVNAPYALKMRSSTAGLLGSMVLAGKATDIIDIGHYIACIFETLALPASDKKRRILLVEDSPFFRSMTVPFLEQAGFEVFVEDNAETAMDFLKRNQQIDLVVTDIEMPGMNGFEFVRMLKKDSRLGLLPVYGFTSNANEKNIELAKQVGFADFIEKTNRSQLIASIYSHTAFKPRLVV